MAGMGDIFFQLGLAISLDEEMLKQLQWSDAPIILTRNLFFQVFSFLLAFMLVLRFMGQDFRDVLYIKTITLKPLLITFGVFAAGMLSMEFLAWLNAPLVDYLPPSVLENEVAMDAMNSALIVQTNPVQFIFTLIIMALIPAICEELVFRGFLIRKMLESGMAKHGAVLLSATIFSLTHFQPLKFLPIFFLGACLGYLYLHFKNIKYAIILHFLINGSQIIWGYLEANGIVSLDF
jgi:membrane protease YdiL (CAAX protease family)